MSQPALQPFPARGERERDREGKNRRLVDLLAVLWLLFVFGLYLVRFGGEYAAANLGRIAEFFQ